MAFLLVVEEGVLVRVHCEVIRVVKMEEGREDRRGETKGGAGGSVGRCPAIGLLYDTSTV